MTKNPDLTFEVDLNVINHLGVGLYSSTPAALAELVANSWDADANQVKITVIDNENKIVIEDDGHGMSFNDLQNKFLKVGFSRRGCNSQNHKSQSGKRYVMGRKGIGKLSMLALSEIVKVYTQQNGQDVVSFEINVQQFKNDIQNGQTHILKQLNEDFKFSKENGTRIELIGVPKKLDRTAKNLKRRLARRFSVKTEQGDHFDIFVNNELVTVADRDYYSKISLAWFYDKDTESEITQHTTNIQEVDSKKCIAYLTNTLKDESGKEYKITGFIASVEKPKDLGEKEENANMISIFTNGKVFVEDVLNNELNTAKIFQSYLVGEIHADFLDRDGTDRATASRESAFRDDPLYRDLIVKLKSDLTTIDRQWDEWRTSRHLDKDDTSTQAITEWIDTLSDSRDKKSAKKIMRVIQNTRFDDENKEEDFKKSLYKNVIVGFETLKLKGQLDKLEKITDVLSPEFNEIFISLEQLEATCYAQITKERLEVIKKFKDIKDDPNSLEKIAQEYLFDNLWLLEPSWDRTSGKAELEKTITTYLKDHTSGETYSGSRLDISYKTSSGRHVIVELKKPSISISSDDITKQVRKYHNAIQKYYKDNYPNEPIPPFDIYMLIKKAPHDWAEAEREALLRYSGMIITYSQLINDAYNTYQEYLNQNQHISKIDNILKKV
ncbi:MAG: ATP-binding protein [Gilliamella sp.]|uniref:BbrUII/HgiDII family restriction enzyme n=1 Tax=Gilliamella sp. TaxID=1891236 RepID=UPI00262D2A7D|nr:ATP-binding protein [Gilliamella sp.]MCO6553370.1 ATP-binding protein [Gilliamella sp.]MCO6560707.1 ATP-binding protein [Gilliamella sp.]